MRNVFEKRMNLPTSGPDVPLFKRFKQEWPKIDGKKFKSGIEDEFVLKAVASSKSDILEFATEELKVRFQLKYLSNNGNQNF